MWTPDYFVRLVEDLPAAARGTTVPNADGTFDIYISARLTDAQRRRCLEHELRHIRADHFSSPLPVADLEREADGLPPRPSLSRPRRDELPYFSSLSSFGAWVREAESSPRR